MLRKLLLLAGTVAVATTSGCVVYAPPGPRVAYLAPAVVCPVVVPGIFFGGGYYYHGYYGGYGYGGYRHYR